MQGYLIMMRSEKETVKAKNASLFEELMGDAELYGWERVRAYHGVWINKLEQGCTTLEEEEEKIKFQCVLVLSCACNPAFSGTMFPTIPWPGLAPRPARPSMRGAVPMQQPIPANSMYVAIVWLQSAGPFHTGDRLH